jgi:hypothetical protein
MRRKAPTFETSSLAEFRVERTQHVLATYRHKDIALSQRDDV